MYVQLKEDSSFIAYRERYNEHLYFAKNTIFLIREPQTFYGLYGVHFAGAVFLVKSGDVEEVTEEVALKEGFFGD